MLMSSSSLFMYLCSMSHSSCSLIIFFEGKNMFLRMSTSSVCRWTFEMRFLIFNIFMIASWVRSILSCTIEWLSSNCDRSVLSCNLPIKFI